MPAFRAALPGGDQLGVFPGLNLLHSFFSCIKNIFSVLKGHTCSCHVIALFITFNIKERLYW